jgi:hypothetical protein
MVETIRSWLSRQSGLALLGLLAASAVVLAALSPFAGKLAAGIPTALYLAWLAFVSTELQRSGRGRWSGPFPQAALIVLVGVAVLVYPLADDPQLGTLFNSEVLGTAARGAFAVALLLVCDHIAAAFAQSEAKWSHKLAAYLLSMLVLLIPPLALLLLHRRIDWKHLPA